MSSTSPFDASLLQAIDDVMSLALYPQVISLAPQHFRTSETQVTCDGKLQALVYDIFLEEGAGKRCSECVVMVALPASLSARSFLFTPACPGQYTHRSFRRWLSTIDIIQHPITFYYMDNYPAPHFEMSPEPFTLVTGPTALFSASEQSHCAIFVRDSE